MDLKDKTKNEMDALLVEKKESLRKFRFNMAGSKIKNVKEGRVLRKDIARIMTEVNKNN